MIRFEIKILVDGHEEMICIHAASVEAGDHLNFYDLEKRLVGSVRPWVYVKSEHLIGECFEPAKCCTESL